jgi:electron transfer flavoprotein-quinone oxidoreductase
VSEKFDVVVVGGGLAGQTAALVAARAGLQVLLAERGVRAGTKTVSGGLLYTHAFGALFPKFWEEEPCPVERAIDRNVLSFLTPERAVSLDYFDAAFSRPPFNSFSVLRGTLDPWLAAKAEGAGATPVYGVKVHELLTDGGRVVGIRADADELRADVVILAEGSNALLSRRARQQPEGAPDLTGVGVKQVIGLPPGEIARRFQLPGRAGTQYSTIGFPQGVKGGGFLYTNRESLSIGLILNLRSLVEANVSMFEVLEEYKQHPFVARLLDGGRLLEYSGCFVAEGGYDALPTLYGDGYLLAGAAAGLFLNNGFTLRGMDFAIESGRLAGEAAVQAVRAHDPSSRQLAGYRERLRTSFVLRELAQFRNYPAVFDNPRLYAQYPTILTELLHRLFFVDGASRPHLGRLLMELPRGRASPLELVRDLGRAMRSL